ncbi:MAG: 4Fe-4S binding protein, partial [Ramlibacter sp.]
AGRTEKSSLLSSMLQLDVLPSTQVNGAGKEVEYRSRGTVLVIGDGIDVLEPAQALAARLRVIAFAPGLEAVKNVWRNLTMVGGRIVSVSGHLGCFRARAAVGSGQDRDMGPFSPNSDGAFDLVLDLSKVPRIRSEIPPDGYFAPRDEAGIRAALMAIPTRVGAFSKPNIVRFESALCTHGRQGHPGCTRCMEVCDAGAIRSNGNMVSVDPHLCQGCAACTMACPTGAISCAVPSRVDLLSRLRKLLDESDADGIACPALVVHVPISGTLVRDLPVHMRAMEVPALPAFGDELWLAALASGFRSVLLVDHAGLSPGARRAVTQALAQAQALVAAVGRGAAAIPLVDADQLQRQTVKPLPAPRKSSRLASHAGSADIGKRRLVIDSLTVLSTGNVGASIALAEGAAFGAVRVRRPACTLCRACANVCPTGALQGDSHFASRLTFRESACVQCGLCVSVCPEHALALQPRAAAFSGSALGATVLAQDAMVRCTQCRIPFISQKMLTHIVSSASAGAFGAQRENPLYLCMDCRSRALFGA